MSAKEVIEKKTEVIFAQLTKLNDEWATISHNRGRVKNLQRKLEIFDRNVRDYLEEAIIYNAEVTEKRDKITLAAFEASLNIVDSLFESVYELNENAVQVQVPTPNLPIPNIELPSFSGSIENWSQFKELFESLIHKNPSLQPLQKLSYLRSQLKGDPLSLVSTYEFVEANYEDAYKALTDRYDSTRRHACYFVRKLMKCKVTSKDVSRTIEQVRGAISNIKKIKTVDLADYLLFELAYNGCEDAIQRGFDSSHSVDKLPATQDLLKHLENLARCQEFRKDITYTTPAKKEDKPRALAAIECSDSSLVELAGPSPFSSQQSLVSSYAALTARADVKTVCKFCSSVEHAIYSCEDFLQLSAAERLEAVKEKRLCFNCLSSHKYRFCKSNSSCRKCNRRHHTLICEGFETKAIVTPPPETPVPSPATAPPAAPAPPAASTTEEKQVSCLSTGPAIEALLGTIQCHVKDAYGKVHKVNVLIDGGSQSILMTADLANRLGLPRKSENKSIVGITQDSTKSLGAMELVLRSVHAADVSFSCTASILPTICARLPVKKVESSVLERFKHLTLADPQFTQRKEIDILLNVQAQAELMTEDLPNFIPGKPAAFKTIFGWVVFGAVPAEESSNVSLAFHATVEDALEDSLRKFWELEEPRREKQVNPEHLAAEAHYNDTHNRRPDGTYVVRLPFKPGAEPELLNNRSAALNSYKNLERRLNRQVDVKPRYDAFMREILELGHMQIATQPSAYVLPHLLVHKETSTSTKTRAVFHASHAASCGKSLNDLLLTGPKIQKHVSDILINFRFHEVAITADIKMMYRMIIVHEDDRKWQHIFWREKADQDIREYELLRLVYGMGCSSFLAQRTVVQVVRDDGEKFPAAAKVLCRDVYMDDIVSGADSVSEALALRDELTQLTAAGGFPLRKWCSSHEEVLRDLDPDHVEKLQVFDSGETGVKVLGLLWKPSSDSFCYKVQPFKGENTKRSVLSLIARLFDPVGYLQPIVITAKILIQKLWLCNIGWDSPLPSDIYAEWCRFAELLPAVTQIEIKRPITTKSTLRLVAFADASEAAYAGVVYVHTASLNDSFSSHLLTAKSKVAPLKKQTIPRLELLGCLLLVRLVKSVLENLGNDMFESVHYFSDSAVALAWIATPAHALKTYVSHRVQEIHENTQGIEWSHCPTHLNPADCASRGLQPDEIQDHPLWWTGPDFLHSDAKLWPTGRPGLTEDLPELKVISLAIKVKPPISDIYELCNRHSSLRGLTRVVGWMLRFVKNARLPNNKRVRGPLVYAELKAALFVCVKVTQAHDFPQELQNKVSSKQLAKLSPFVDRAGYLRVGGRLRQSSLAEDTKHPLLLSKQSHLATLVCDYYHELVFHGGLLTTMAVIQRVFWITSLRALVRSRVNRCIKCFKVKMKPGNAYMADLPAPRVTASEVFKHVGTDFAGPILIKTSSLRSAKTVKGYICVFVCMATTACHVELVSELTMEAFAATFTRFVSRRGLPTDMYSDNGKNFLGYSNRLREVYRFLEDHKEALISDAAARQVRWHFNPPLASHHGGLWEANVKNIKTLLYRQVGNASLTFEELATLLTRIEAVLNSRPLEFSSDPNDGFDYLTPGHCLIGSSFFASPEIPLDDKTTPRCRWERVRQISQSLWSRWSKTYLNSLMQRNKWVRGQTNLSVGQVVYVTDTNTAPLSWPLGRIVAVHPAKDDVVRVVTVRVRGTDYLRPITKIVAAPV